jgi:hypothetical protein
MMVRLPCGSAGLELVGSDRDAVLVREQPHLPGLLLVVPAPERALADIREGAAQGVQVVPTL